MTRPVAAPGLPRRAAPLPPLGFLLLGGLTFFWGANWPVMKIALAEIAPWPFRSLCLVVGGLALLAINVIGRKPVRVPARELRPLLICALFNVVGWHLFSAYALTLIEASRATIIAFTMPIWAALLGRVVLGEALTGSKLLGLALGTAGLTILIGPDLAGLGSAPLGAAFMLGGAISWAIGTVAMKRFAWTIGPGTLAGWQLLAGSVPITLGALWLQPFPDPATLSPATLAALAYVLLVPMVFCQWAWFKVVWLFPASLAAVGTLAIPVIGVFSSGLLLDEPIGWREFAALGLVCAALAAVLLVPALRQSRGR
jgi:drug/metabolite transporter (DMT)-like permease